MNIFKLFFISTMYFKINNPRDFRNIMSDNLSHSCSYKFHSLNLLPSENTFTNIQVLKRSCVKLLTYNFFLRPPPIKTNKDDYKDERLEDFKAYMDNFDIICLQEVFGSFSSRKEKMIKNAKERGFDYYAAGQTPSLFSKFLIDGGLLILSRFPILECRKINYDCGVMSDGMSMKGAIYCKIKIKNNYLCLFVTHLQASYLDSGEKLWKSCLEIRKEQAETLINFIYDNILKIPNHEKKKCKFILCGDFNMDGYEYKDLIKRYKLPNFNYNEIEDFVNKLKVLGNVENLTKKKFKKYPYTFGDNSGEFDKVLTDKTEANTKQCLDYIFEIFPDYTKPIFKKYYPNISMELLQKENSDESKSEFMDSSTIKEKDKLEENLSVNYDSTKVEYFTVKERPYQQLSDHFGVSVEIELEKEK